MAMVWHFHTHNFLHPSPLFSYCYLLSSFLILFFQMIKKIKIDEKKRDDVVVCGRGKEGKAISRILNKSLPI